MSDAPELLPCPFCGGAAEAISLFRPPHRGNTFVKCKGCGAAGRRGGYGWAISNWNIRADTVEAADALDAHEASIAALVKALRTAADDLDDYSPLTGNTIETPASRAARAALEALGKEKD